MIKRRCKNAPDQTLGKWENKDIPNVYLEHLLKNKS